MKDEKEIIYRYNDEISFRTCSLFDSNKTTYGDCTAFQEKEEHFKTYFYCRQYGIHFHCTKHPNIEFEQKRDDIGEIYLKCPQCNNLIQVENIQKLVEDCLKLLNIEKFKNAKLIRLDDWYIPEVKAEVKDISNYWIKVNVKTDKDNDTIIVLYVGKKDSNEKTQFFIKPEKLGLTSDYKDLDPATILSKIEVTLKDRTLKQEYDNDY